MHNSESIQVNSICGSACTRQLTVHFFILSSHSQFWTTYKSYSRNSNPIYTRSKNRHGTPNFWHRASFTLAETTSGRSSSPGDLPGTCNLCRLDCIPPGGSLGTPKILSTGAPLHLGPIRLHVENWVCRALQSSARCQKFGVPCRFFEHV